jgi:centrin-1
MIADRHEEGSTSLDFEEFLDLMVNRVSRKDTKQDIRKIFNLFDEEKTGYITIKTLKKVIKDLGENIDESELQEMIQKADLDKDGMVSEE